MKIRKGFVSNSSSSSFVCEVCARVESGYDMGYEEAGFCECQAGHGFCSHHTTFSVDSMTIEDKRIHLMGTWNAKDKKYQDMPDEEIEDIFESEHADDIHGNIPKEACPICSLDSVRSKDMTAYLLQVVGKTQIEIEEEIRGKFSNIDELGKSLDGV